MLAVLRGILEILMRPYKEGLPYKWEGFFLRRWHGEIMIFGKQRKETFWEFSTRKSSHEDFKEGANNHTGRKTQTHTAIRGGLRSKWQSHRPKDHTVGCILEKTTITPPRVSGAYQNLRKEEQPPFLHWSSARTTSKSRITPWFAYCRFGLWLFFYWELIISCVF